MREGQPTNDARDRRPLVSVIVPARNASATIARTLAALRNQSLEGGFEIVVVDDGSSDETVAIATQAGARVIQQTGQGPGQARNRGAATARGAALAFTDADCFPETDWLAEGVRALDQLDLAQGRVVPDASAPRGPFDHTIWVVGESGLYETANLFVRRELFEQLGGFEDWLDVEIGKRLGEDVWFGWRARRAGARTGFASRALVQHAVFPRTRREFIAERRRLIYFPSLVRKMPELRGHFLKLGLFVTWRSAAFDLAVVGAIGALVALAFGASAWGLVGLAVLIPYGVLTLRRIIQLGRSGPQVCAVEAAADAAGFMALVRGSLGARTVVL
jgi:glycosyltransferase involved in cell wall biosynthesis